MTPQQVQDLKDLFSKRYGRLLVLVIIGIVIGVGVVLSHRLQEDRHNSDRVVAWHNTYNYMLTDLVSDLSQAETDSKNNNLPAVGTACTKLEKDAEADMKAPKIPDPSIQKYWMAALKDDAGAALDCSDAAKQSSPTLMSDATSAFQKGSTNLEVVSHDFKLAEQNK